MSDEINQLQRQGWKHGDYIIGEGLYILAVRDLDAIWKARDLVQDIRQKKRDLEWPIKLKVISQ